jgi:hypothetical protein
MRNCTALAVTVGHLAGSIIYLEEHRTLHSEASYESTLKMLQNELAKAAEAYFKCMNPPK